MNNKNSIIIKNIYYMLSYAYQTLMQQDKVDVDGESFEHIYDLFAAILVKGISNLIRKGIQKDYIETIDEQMFLRGKIEWKNSLALKMKHQQRLVCVYDEYSENCLTNQILKSVCVFLMKRNDVKVKNKTALKKLMLTFSEVELINITEINWNSICYNRFNATYQMLLNICCLAAEEMILTEETGKLTLSSFQDEQKMHRLYEKFVLEYYKRWHKKYKPAAKIISWNVEGNVQFLPRMQSDIMLSYGDEKLIIDTKYYTNTFQRYHERETLHSNNLYQIYAYVKNQDKEETGNVSGLLLYAKTSESPDLDMEYQMGKNRIAVMTLNLGTDFEGIKNKLDQIILNYFHNE